MAIYIYRTCIYSITEFVSFLPIYTDYLTFCMVDSDCFVSFDFDFLGCWNSACFATSYAVITRTPIHTEGKINSLANPFGARLKMCCLVEISRRTDKIN